MKIERVLKKIACVFLLFLSILTVTVNVKTKNANLNQISI